MIKYLGSKRRLVPVLGAMTSELGATSALDPFSGTTRVAQEMKRRGAHVTAGDIARYTEVFGRCYVETDARTVDRVELEAAIAHLEAVPDVEGYVTEVFCRTARFFHPDNGRRIDAIRDEIRESFSGHHLEAILLTSLIEAADRVDSTTGVQMAYVKSWADRALRPLRLRVPELLAGTGSVRRCDARALARASGPVDLAYLDPPYNQHRYFTNYHVWETIVAWDAPEHYGVACKRLDAKDPSTRTAFDRRREMPAALAEVIATVDARVVVVSCNDESWLSFEELWEMCEGRGTVAAVGFDSARYVGARIGIHSPSGEKVGAPGRLRNVERLFLAGPAPDVERLVAVAVAGGGLPISSDQRERAR